MEASNGFDTKKGGAQKGRVDNRPSSTMKVETQHPKTLPIQHEHEPLEVKADEYRDNKPVYRVDNTPSDTLVIHCSSPRFQKAFRQFVTEELGIEYYTPIMIGGGLHAFGVQSFLPKNLKFLWEQIKFFVKEQNIRSIIIINHRDCRWYEKMKGYYPTVDLPTKGRIDLRSAAKTLLSDFGGVHIRSFYADLHGDEIVFEEVS
jgi:hypothetical protein